MVIDFMTFNNALRGRTNCMNVEFLQFDFFFAYRAADSSVVTITFMFLQSIQTLLDGAAEIFELATVPD